MADLYATADFCLIPMGIPEPSVAVYIAECARVLEKSGLVYKMHKQNALLSPLSLPISQVPSGYGTNIEGPWTQVCEAIKACHEAVHVMGVPRIATDVRIGTRVDRENAPGQVNENKVKRVEEILRQDVK